jgi:hypothetical protein
VVVASIAVRLSAAVMTATISADLARSRSLSLFCGPPDEGCCGRVIDGILFVTPMEADMSTPHVRRLRSVVGIVLIVVSLCSPPADWAGGFGRDEDDYDDGYLYICDSCGSEWSYGDEMDGFECPDRRCDGWCELA